MNPKQRIQETAELPPQVRNTLLKLLGYDATLEDLCHLSEPRLLRCPGIWRRNLNKIKQALEKHGFKLNTKPLWEDPPR